MQDNAQLEDNAGFRRRMEKMLRQELPPHVRIAPLSSGLPDKLPWENAAPHHQDAVLVTLHHSNRGVALLSLLLPAFFILIALNAARSGYFDENTKGVLSFVIAGAALLLVIYLIFKQFMLRITWLLLEPDQILCCKEGAFGNSIQRIPAASIDKVLRDQCPILGKGNGYKTYVVALVHDGEYTEIAKHEHGTAWLARLLGAAANITPSGALLDN